MEVFILKFLFSVILTEAITEIITKSQIFTPFRKFFFKRRKHKFFDFIHELLDCGYCTSVWIGMFVAFCLYYQSYGFVKLFFIGLVIHRSSNILHFIVDRINKEYTLYLKEKGD